MHEHVGGGGQIQPELIGAHRCRAGPVGEQIQLLFFYAVLHVAPRTVEVFVECAGPQAFRRQGGDDESGIGAFLRRCCMIQLRREWGRFSNFSFRTPQRRISAYPARPSG